MNFQIQKLNASQLSYLKQLRGCFARAFELEALYRQTTPNEKYYRSLLDDPHQIYLVAVHEEQVIGGLVAYELRKLEQARSEIYIYDLAVDLEYRRKGVATKLINTLSKIAADRGAWVVFVQADNDDPPAIALYESLGTREDVCHFDIPVVPHERAL